MGHLHRAGAVEALTRALAVDSAGSLSECGTKEVGWHGY